MKRTSKRTIQPGFDDLEGRQLLSTLPGPSPSAPAITALHGQISAAAYQSSGAYAYYFFLSDRATGFNLDSNANQQIYTHDFNGGAYQKWQLIPTSGPDGTFFLRDDATGFYLDSNASQQVYTHDFNGGTYQKWQLSLNSDGYFTLQDEATGFYLDSNASQQVYTHDGNGGAYQQWRLDGTTP